MPVYFKMSEKNIPFDTDIIPFDTDIVPEGKFAMNFALIQSLANQLLNNQPRLLHNGI